MSLTLSGCFICLTSGSSVARPARSSCRHPRCGGPTTTSVDPSNSSNDLSLAFRPADWVRPSSGSSDTRKYLPTKCDMWVVGCRPPTAANRTAEIMGIRASGPVPGNGATWKVTRLPTKVETDSNPRSNPECGHQRRAEGHHEEEEIEHDRPAPSSPAVVLTNRRWIRPTAPSQSRGPTRHHR